MLTLKIIGADCTSWIPDVREVSRWDGGVQVPGEDTDVVKLLTEMNHHLDADVIWHVTGRNDGQPWYAIVIQARYADGSWHHHVIEDGQGFLLGPDGKTLDRLWNSPGVGT